MTCSDWKLYALSERLRERCVTIERDLAALREAGVPLHAEMRHDWVELLDVAALLDAASAQVDAGRARRTAP